MSATFMAPPFSGVEVTGLPRVTPEGASSFTLVMPSEKLVDTGWEPATVLSLAHTVTS